MPLRSVVLAEDETDVLLFPPLRATWSPRGTPCEVVLSGHNARRVVFGTLNIRTGKRLFLVRTRQRQEDFQAFLTLLHWHYRGWCVALLLDEDPSHTAAGSQRLAERYQMKLLWLPHRSPELNPLDHLWGKGKTVASANLQYPSVEHHATALLDYLQALSPHEALTAAGVLSDHFWLKSILRQNFCIPA